MAQSLPQYAQTKAANGYRRELTAIGDPDGSAEGKGKALLVCRGRAPEPTALAPAWCLLNLDFSLTILR